MKRRWCKHHLGGDPAEVNITAFMNLMVILVPFLLITAVFSRITILDMNLPAAGDPAQTVNPDELHLEVIVRQSVIEIGDRKNGLLKLIAVTADGGHLHQVSELLQQIKARYPDKQDVALLLEKDTPYERLIEMMDTLRVAQVKQEGETVMAELFPVISIGDAPVDALRTATRNGP